ncbi:MAG: hypothetical protein A2Y38_22650 [Spirochaetes bacterium GWB1_59_5]|nr:MAG: hypothetical protein A2Y38_22650 [Spirochaetes bacterium GWB1_59_5]
MQVYIAIFIALLAIIASVLVIKRKTWKRVPLRPLSGLALLFIIAGIVFGRFRLLGYGFVSVGAVLAIVDAVRKARNR